MMISLKKSLGTKSYFCVNSSLYHFRLYQILTISFQIVSTPYYIISDCINSENLIRKVVIRKAALRKAVLRKIMMISLKTLLGTKSYFCVNSSLYHFRLYQIITISFQIVSTPYYIISDCINSEILIGDDILFRAEVYLGQRFFNWIWCRF